MSELNEKIRETWRPHGEFKHRYWFLADTPNIDRNFCVIWKDLWWWADPYPPLFLLVNTFKERPITLIKLNLNALKRIFCKTFPSDILYQGHWTCWGSWWGWRGCQLSTLEQCLSFSGDRFSYTLLTHLHHWLYFISMLCLKHQIMKIRTPGIKFFARDNLILQFHFQLTVECRAYCGFAFPRKLLKGSLCCFKTKPVTACVLLVKGLNLLVTNKWISFSHSFFVSFRRDMQVCDMLFLIVVQGVPGERLLLPGLRVYHAAPQHPGSCTLIHTPALLSSHKLGLQSKVTYARLCYFFVPIFN